MSVNELDELIIWLHTDLDECLVDSGDVEAKENYQKMFSCLSMLRKQEVSYAA